MVDGEQTDGIDKSLSKLPPHEVPAVKSFTSFCDQYTASNTAPVGLANNIYPQPFSKCHLDVPICLDVPTKVDKLISTFGAFAPPITKNPRGGITVPAGNAKAA